MNFDKLIDRRLSFSSKWDKYAGKDILPCWVADTEFLSPEPVIQALADRLHHGVLGYTDSNKYEPGLAAIAHWLQIHYHWSIEKSWIVWNPGVVTGFTMACRAFCQPGDHVLVQRPNYPPLLAAPAMNGLVRQEIQTIKTDNGWQLDMNELETKLANPKVSLFILCNPMNPVGQVLSRQQLMTISTLCNQYDVMLCSDEIHCDLILDPGTQHFPAGSIAGLEQRSITLMAASKTFNIAGLGTSFAIVPDANLRKRFVKAGAGIVSDPNILGLIATTAAFNEGEPYRLSLLQYLRENQRLLSQSLSHISALHYRPAPATFLAWVDAAGLGVDNVQRWFEDSGVGPSPGVDFGWPNFVRINFACSRSQLQQIIDRTQRATEKLPSPRLI